MQGFFWSAYQGHQHIVFITDDGRVSQRRVIAKAAERDIAFASVEERLDVRVTETLAGRAEFGPKPAVPKYPRRRSVFTPRSSNRTCRLGHWGSTQDFVESGCDAATLGSGLSVAASFVRARRGAPQPAAQRHRLLRGARE
jgi:anti-sigma-K factor RskA